MPRDIVLNPSERRRLALVNDLLTDLTKKHSPNCNCELCQARMLTDVSEEASFYVPHVLLTEEDPDA